jgi:hypothetical protein
MFGTQVGFLQGQLVCELVLMSLTVSVISTKPDVPPDHTRPTFVLPHPGTRRNMSHVVELTKDCTSAVLIVKASRPLIFKELTRMPGLWLAYFPSQRSKDGHVFYH